MGVNKWRNNSNCKGLPLLITIYHPGFIPHSFANKTRLIDYKQLSYVDIYDSNVSLKLE